MDGNNGLTVRKIRHGTVIDHIPAGRALKVLRILGVTPEQGYTIAILMNVESRKIERKDIVKISGLEPRIEDFHKISLIAPTATINIVKDYKVIRKEKVKPPKEVRGILRCINPTCITRQPRENAVPTFRLIRDTPVTYQCIYCGSLLEEREILEQLAG